MTEPDVAVERPRSSGGRALGFGHVAFATALALVVASIALTTRQPPPPTIAEFAPQAIQQIKQTQSNQTSDSGSGVGDCPPGAENCATNPKGDPVGPGGKPGSPPPASASPSGPVVDVARAHQCVGSPPRQIDDPQSPPCVAYWDNSKGNGGATAPGVTESTITVAYYISHNDTANDTTDAGPNAYDVYGKFFNEKFELYGRKIKFVSVGEYPASAAAAAASVDRAKELGAFAMIGYQDTEAGYERAAVNKIVMSGPQAMFTDPELARLAPYVWIYPMSASAQLRKLGQWACNRLAKDNAVFGGTAGSGFQGKTAETTDLKTVPRKFGAYLRKISPDMQLTIDPLRDALEACGSNLAVFFQHTSSSSDNAFFTNSLLKMKEQGVTTIFSLQEGWQGLETAQRNATAQQYEPEWILSSYPQYYPGFFTTGATGRQNADQLRHTFGLVFMPMDRVTQDHPSRWAYTAAGYPWPAKEDVSTGIFGFDIAYHEMLLLASGFQMAGPNLTAETFADALHRTVFPNPEHPIKAGKVGFNEGDFTMMNDGLEVWWNGDVVGPYRDQTYGAFCWDTVVGRRSSNWPMGRPRLFDPTNCDLGTRSVS